MVQSDAVRTPLAILMSVLQCVAGCYGVLQLVAMCYKALQYVAVSCSVFCRMLQRVAE